jgi:outer membrane protein OmpA-like peptidoglycan-associated protein
VTDEIALSLDAGTRAVTIWADPALDVAQLITGRFDRLARLIADRGASLQLVVDPMWLDALDPAARLALRDAAKARPFALAKGQPPRFTNGAVAIAAADGDASTLWASRDAEATILGPNWGQASSAPVVRVACGKTPLAVRVDLDGLLPVSGTRFLELRDDIDGTIAGFGQRFIARLLPAIREAGGTGVLTRIDYNDRYLQSPLVVRLMAEALLALRDALAGSGTALPVAITTNRFRPNERQPFAPDHDWQWEDDRRDVLTTLLENGGLTPVLDEHGAGHARVPAAILFAKSDYRLSGEGQQAVATIARSMADVLPCYTYPRRTTGCRETSHSIDAIFIEGHTDSDPLAGSGPISDNMDLSALRATNTFRAMEQAASGLAALDNRDSRPILSVSGYGADRPVPGNAGADEEAKSRNRRIDLRFLMETPKVEGIVSLLTGGGK